MEKFKIGDKLKRKKYSDLFSWYYTSKEIEIVEELPFNHFKIKGDSLKTYEEIMTLAELKEHYEIIGLSSTQTTSCNHNWVKEYFFSKNVYKTCSICKTKWEDIHGT